MMFNEACLHLPLDGYKNQKNELEVSKTLH